MNQLEDIAPVKPIAAYIGGKIRLAGKIVDLINETPHDSYIEPFIGMGGVFLRRNKKPKAEVINDINLDLISLYRVVRHHHAEFLKEIYWLVSSRDEWDRFKSINPNSLTDIQRAARFYFLQLTSFGGKVTGQAFAMGKQRPGRFNYFKIRPKLNALRKRLAEVTIERMHFADLITKYDRVGVLFYLDPPYFGNETDYGKDFFCREDFLVLANLLKSIKGKFILSINDKPEIQELFHGFKMQEVDLAYSLGPIESGKRFGELIISN